MRSVLSNHESPVKKYPSVDGRRIGSSLSLYGVKYPVGLERFDGLDERQAAMKTEPFSGVAVPLDIEAVAGDPVEAGEGGIELLAEIFRETGAVALD